jgi:4-hydroxy-tetrahydrodipicolinate synthase
MKDLTHSALKGDWDRARKLHYELLPLFKAIFLETNPIPIKATMAMKGFVEEVYRLPMCPMSAENKKALTEVLKQLKIL